MRVLSLHVHPLKGGRAISVARADVGLRGFENDRRWLAVDASGRFTSQRSHPVLAAITAEPTPVGLRLSAPGAVPIEVATPTGGERLDVRVWSDTLSAALCAPAAHAWLSALFGEPLRLVHLDARAERFKRSEWIAAPAPISFADAYPILVTATASLSALNREIESRGGQGVPMARFRPNTVVACDDPWAEDTWKVLRVGDAVFDLVKPCDRCIVTTTDQATGERRGKEPLASLARLRRSADPRINGVLFGWNAVPRAPASVAAGDTVEVLERRPEGFALRPPPSPAAVESEVLEGLDL